MGRLVQDSQQRARHVVESLEPGKQEELCKAFGRITIARGRCQLLFSAVAGDTISVMLPSHVQREPMLGECREPGALRGEGILSISLMCQNGVRLTEKS